MSDLVSETGKLWIEVDKLKIQQQKIELLIIDLMERVQKLEAYHNEG